MMIPFVPDSPAAQLLDLALQQITGFWDSIKEAPVSELSDEGRALAEDWMGFGVTLTNLLDPRIALFFKSPVGDTLLDAYQVPLWLKALAPDLIGNVNLHRIPSRPADFVLTHQTAQPGAGIEGDAFGVTNGTLVGSENGTLGAFCKTTKVPRISGR